MVDDLLAWRASFNVDKGAGDIKNVYNEDSTYQNTDRLSGRLQLLATPTDNFTARLAVEVQPRSGENTNGRTFYINSDNALSRYGEIPAHSIVEFGVGLGTLDRKYDVTLLAKNLLDDDTPLARTWNSYTPATSRWFGVMVSGKL